MKNRNLYIPIEIYQRELKGMLILSIVAASKGWRVVLGGKKALLPNLHKLPEGISLLKSIVPGEAPLQMKLKSFGHKIASLDAEGLVMNEGESAITMRFSEKTVENSDLILFWGKRQEEKVSHYFPEVLKVGVKTGSPTFDYWRLKKEKYKSSKTTRKKILIATSFAYPNHYIGEDFVRKLYEDTLKQGLDKKEYIENFNQEGDLQKIILPEFKKYVEQVIKSNPDCDIVLRPHINENPQIWKEIGDRYENVTMSLSGEISDLILDTDILIHYNSTTSIEAHFYGKTILSYVPKEIIPDYLFKRLNRHAKKATHMSYSLEEALLKVREAVEGKISSTDMNLEEIITDSTSSEIFQSSLNIVEALERVKSSEVTRDFPSRYKLYMNSGLIVTSIKQRIVWLLGWVDHYTKMFNGKYEQTIHNFRYGKSKQGKLDFRNLVKTAKLILEAQKINENDISVERLKEGIVLIEKR